MKVSVQDGSVIVVLSERNVRDLHSMLGSEHKTPTLSKYIDGRLLAIEVERDDHHYKPLPGQMTIEEIING
jgi:hypothetical protein